MVISPIQGIEHMATPKGLLICMSTGSEHKVDPHLLPFFHLTAGQILLPEFDQPHFGIICVFTVCFSFISARKFCVMSCVCVAELFLNS